MTTGRYTYTTAIDITSDVGQVATYTSERGGLIDALDGVDMLQARMTQLAQTALDLFADVDVEVPLLPAYKPGSLASMANWFAWAHEHAVPAWAVEPLRQLVYNVVLGKHAQVHVYAKAYAA